MPKKITQYDNTKTLLRIVFLYLSFYLICRISRTGIHSAETRHSS